MLSTPTQTVPDSQVGISVKRTFSPPSVQDSSFWRGHRWGLKPKQSAQTHDPIPASTIHTLPQTRNLGLTFSAPFPYEAPSNSLLQDPLNSSIVPVPSATAPLGPQAALPSWASVPCLQAATFSSQPEGLLPTSAWKSPLCCLALPLPWLLEGLSCLGLSSAFLCLVLI